MIRTNIPGRDPIELVAYYNEFSWYYPNCELETKKWFVKNARPDWVFFDVGANIGYYTILFSQLSPSGFVYSFEPTATADMLVANLSYNHVTNAEIQRTAVGREGGVRSEPIYRIWGESSEQKLYEFTTVDDFCRTGFKHDRLDCLKIDVDSFDFEVLQGAEKSLERFNPWVVVELNHALARRGSSSAEAFLWLSRRGYKHGIVLDNENVAVRRSVELGALSDRALSFELLFTR